MTEISRRDFVALAAVAAVGGPMAPNNERAGAAVTAQEIVDRIRKSIGIEWNNDTVDS